MKKTIFVDTTNGPRIITRHEFNFKPLLKAMLLVAVVLAILMASIVITSVAAPKVKVSWATGGSLVFQDMEGNYLAYVDLANADQFEQIKNLNVLVQENVDNFRLCSTEVHHFKIRLGLENEKVFVHGKDVVPPAQYNYSLSDSELDEMLDVSSEEAQYLYRELSRIFKTA